MQQNIAYEWWEFLYLGHPQTGNHSQKLQTNHEEMKLEDFAQLTERILILVKDMKVILMLGCLFGGLAGCQIVHENQVISFD